jgi:hypothetical protein
MREKLSAIDAGILLGLFFGTLNLFWIGLIISKYAQGFLDFIFWIHFIKPFIQVESFDLFRSLILLAVTTFTGFTLGYLLARILNTLNSRET